MASCDPDATFWPIIIQVGKGVLSLVKLHGSVLEALNIFLVVVACAESNNEGHDRKGQCQFCKDFIHGVVV